MRLKVSRSNIVSFLNSIFSSFEERAVAQGIRYEFIAHSEEILCWFDSRQLRKVFLICCPMHLSIQKMAEQWKWQFQRKRKIV